jgi:protein TonB
MKQRQPSRVHHPVRSTEEEPNMKILTSGEVSPGSGSEPELHLLLPETYEPLWKSLFRGCHEFLSPEKLPPLKLESKPVIVKEIWGFNNYKRNGVWGSSAAHVILLALIIGVPLIPIHRPLRFVDKPHIETPLIFPGVDLLKPAKQEIGGGGGGGDRDPLPASLGRLPAFSMRQITPPVAVLRNPTPKLPVDPTVAVPPDIQIIAKANLPNLGDPKSYAIIPSNGPGDRGGIGTGSDDGVGPGHGPGVGPGEKGGYGGDSFRMGKGVTAPRLIYQTDPEFSEEARKAKYQGNCVLGLIVDPSGHPTNIRVLNALGMGLDQKAIDSVKNWRFEPGKKDGRGVAVEIAVEVDFHLY